MSHNKENRKCEQNWTLHGSATPPCTCPVAKEKHEEGCKHEATTERCNPAGMCRIVCLDCDKTVIPTAPAEEKHELAGTAYIYEKESNSIVHRTPPAPAEEKHKDWCGGKLTNTIPCACMPPTVPSDKDVYPTAPAEEKHEHDWNNIKCPVTIWYNRDEQGVHAPKPQPDCDCPTAPTEEKHEPPCKCKSKSCPKDCARYHTHHGYSCENCEPVTAPAEDKHYPPCKCNRVCAPTPNDCVCVCDRVATQPTSDWEERFDKLFADSFEWGELKYFIAKQIAQAKEDGRREAEETRKEWDRRRLDILTMTREEVITLFEEWAKNNGSYYNSNESYGKLVVVDDLLAYADSLKNKV